MTISSIPRWVAMAAAFVAMLARSPAAPEASAQFQTTPTLFSGQAVAVNGTVLGMPITLIDTGTVAVEGGTLQAHLFCYPNGADCTLGLPDATNGALGVSLLNATVVAQGHQSRARASIADLSLNLPGYSVTAAFVQAEATAQCSAGQASIDGHSEIAELVINGQTITITGAVNQEVPLPNGIGRVVINEQVASVNGDKMTVTALHVEAPALGTDVSVAQAHADIQCGQKVCPSDRDFVTGGGWLGDPRKTFSVAGGLKNGAYWGHLQYIDHGARKRVKGTSVTRYDVTGPTTRHIEGICLIDGVQGTYQVDVDDQGEPGKNDMLTLALNHVTEVRGNLEGGNLQLHTCK
jgi:hypothetical protein